MLFLSELSRYGRYYSNFSIPRPNRNFLAVVLAPLYTFPSREISLKAKLARSVESIGVLLRGTLNGQRALEDS
jgi:hypothetical protein